MSRFTDSERHYLTGERRLGRLATVGRDGMPHAVPTGFTLNAELDTIDVGGIELERTKKYRDIRRTGRATIVIDDVLPPWQPRGVEIRARAEALDGLLRLHPVRIVSWGLDSDAIGDHHARDVS